MEIGTQELGHVKLVHMGRTRQSQIGQDKVGVYFTFGKHAYHYLRWIAAGPDRSYLEWTLGQPNFGKQVKTVCRQAIKWADSGEKWSDPECAEEARRRDAKSIQSDIDRIWPD